MRSSIAPGYCGITRRGFLLGAGVGLATGASLGWLGRRELLQHARMDDASPSFAATTREVAQAPLGMPGPFPGRVIEIHDRGAMRPDNTISAETVKAMMKRGMIELTGADHPAAAWRRLFEPGDVVGIKVNPVGRAPKPGEAGRWPRARGAISRPEVLIEVVRGLKSAGVAARDILVIERYAEEFVDAGYEEVMRTRDLDGVRWFASAVRYDVRQVDIRGFDSDCSPELARHVVGYDPDVYAYMGFANPSHDPKDERRFRSHLSVLVSRMINKLVTIPVLKDHRSAGVTLALKNLSHGLNNNVQRSHLSGIVRRDGSISGPNQCNTFIPTAVAQLPTRQKATLHILDGLIGVYEGGPGNWNQTWGTWTPRSLFFATDPVALDHVGWDIIDRKRAQQGWPPVGMMGLLQNTPQVRLSNPLTALAGPHALGTSILEICGENLAAGRATELFDRRQPEHIILAGELGLGVFDAARIEHRRIVL